MEGIGAPNCPFDAQSLRPHTPLAGAEPDDQSDLGGWFRTHQSESTLSRRGDCDLYWQAVHRLVRPGCDALMGCRAKEHRAISSLRSSPSGFSQPGRSGREHGLTVYVGDDWSKDHHDVHVMNEEGESLAARRLPEGAEGTTALYALLAEHVQEANQVVVGIETDRGPWVAALIGAGYRVYAINPRVAALYRKRHQLGGGKSDRGDARMLANLVRTDSRNHREVAGDSAHASAVQVRDAPSSSWSGTARARATGCAARCCSTSRPRSRRSPTSRIQTRSRCSPSPRSRSRRRSRRGPRSARRSAAEAAGATWTGGRRRCERRSASARSMSPPPLARRSLTACSRRSLSSRRSTGSSSYWSRSWRRVLTSTRTPRSACRCRDWAPSRRNYAGTSPITMASGRKRAVTARNVRPRRLYDAVHM